MLDPDHPALDPDLIPTEGVPHPTVRTLTWTATLLGPLLLWVVGWWLVGRAQPDLSEPECAGICLTQQEQVWFVGVAWGLFAVPLATTAGAVAMALTAPMNRARAAGAVLGVDGLLLAMALESVVESG